MGIICIYVFIQLFVQHCPRPRLLDITGIQMMSDRDMQGFLILLFNFSFANCRMEENTHKKQGRISFRQNICRLKSAQQIL